MAFNRSVLDGPEGAAGAVTPPPPPIPRGLGTELTLVEPLTPTGAAALYICCCLEEGVDANAAAC